MNLKKKRQKKKKRMDFVEREKLKSSLSLAV
jgi:hypothetical protein